MDSGGILIALLRLIEPFRIPQTGGFKNALNVHRFIESLKFAFAARSEVTDPAFSKDPSRLDRFWKTGWPDEVRAKITDVSLPVPIASYVKKADVSEFDAQG
jgi:gamma-glutamyltranspeptidase/glutathione hydrolase/leukotriene-C4 hydrolase